MRLTAKSNRTSGKLPKTNTVGSDVESGCILAEGESAGGKSKTVADLDAVAAPLLGLEEGLFRTIVGFL